MILSIFLARVLGVYCILVCSTVLFRRKDMEIMVNELGSSRALMYISGLWSLLVGLIIVNLHQVWIWDWPVLITIIGWLAVIKGMLRLFFMEHVLIMARQMQRQKLIYTVIVILFFVIGVYLTYIGFSA